MATLPELEIAIGADITEIKRALQSVGRDIQGLKSSASKPSGGIDLGIDKARAGLSGLVSQIKAAAAAYASFQSVGALARIADEAAVLTARLKLATTTQQEFNRAQAGTFDIAQKTRTSVGATIDLYARLERSTRELGVNQATLLQLTESINQAAQISGGGPGAEAALFQLSQGLASGVLRGEELNSVLEQTPRLSQAIADGLGVPIGKLRELAQEGKLTADAVARALISQKDVIAGEYGELPLTIAGSLTQLRNAFVKFVGDANSASGASAKIAKGIKALADNLPKVITAVSRLAAVWAAYIAVFKVVPGIIALVIAAKARLIATMTALTTATTTATGAAAKLSAALTRLQVGGVAFVAGWQVGTYLRENFAGVEAAGVALVEGLLVSFEELKKYGRILVAFFDTAFDDLYAILTFGDRKDAAGAFRAQMDKITAESEAAVAAIRANFVTAYDEIEQGGSIASRRAAEAARNAAAAASNEQIEIKPAAIAAPDATKFKAGLRAVSDANDLLIDNIDRALTALEQRYDDNLVGLSAYYAERTRLQTQSVDAELQAKRQELVALEAEESQLRAGGQDNTGNVEARARLLTEIVKLERDRAEIGVTAAREQAAAERELADQLLQVRARLAEATGQTAEARRQQIETEFAELRSSLEASGNAAGVELVDRLINVESAKANLDELQTSITDTLQNLRAQEDNITAQIDAGIIGQVRGEEDLQNLRERSIEQLQRYRVALEAAYAAAKDPAIQAEIQKRLTELDTELARVTASTQQLRNQLRDIGQNGLEGFFRDITSGTKSIGDAFRSLISSIAGDIASLASRNVAKAIVGQISGAFGGGGGNFLSGIGSFFSSFFHRGGIVGQGAQIQRAVPAWAFAGAPRFHSGGVAGLKPDEVPAVLQRGEEVLAKNDPRNSANGQQGGFRVVNVVDPKMAADYLESSEGERVIMNIIGRNPGQVRQLLG